MLFEIDSFLSQFVNLSYAEYLTLILALIISSGFIGWYLTYYYFTREVTSRDDLVHHLKMSISQDSVRIQELEYTMSEMEDKYRKLVDEYNVLAASPDRIQYVWNNLTMNWEYVND